MSMGDAGAVPVLDAQDQGLAPQIEHTAEQVTLSLLNACKQMADHAAGAADTREGAEAARAALALAQAVVVLDPELDGQGVSIERQIALTAAQATGQAHVEEVRGANALAQARERASAPTPAKGVRQAAQR